MKYIYQIILKGDKMTDKIEAAKEIASTVSSDIAKISQVSAEISQCVAMGAKA